MTVRELLARVGSDELTEWLAYYRIEPFGQVRGDLQAGIVAATVVNALRGLAGASSGEGVQPGRFLLEFGKAEAKEPDPEAMKDRLRAFTAMRGGEVR